MTHDEEALIFYKLIEGVLPVQKSSAVSDVAAYLSEGLTTAVSEAMKP
jgi:hypothetical protein